MAIFGEADLPPIPEENLTPRVLLNEPYVYTVQYFGDELFLGKEPVIRMDYRSDPASDYSLTLDDYSPKSFVTIHVTDPLLMGSTKNIMMKIMDKNTNEFFKRININFEVPLDEIAPPTFATPLSTYTKQVDGKANWKEKIVLPELLAETSLKRMEIIPDRFCSDIDTIIDEDKRQIWIFIPEGLTASLDCKMELLLIDLLDDVHTYY